MILWEQLALFLEKSVSFMQGSLVPLQDRNGDGLADPSPQASLEKPHLYWASNAFSTNQNSERVSYSKLILKAVMEQKASGFQRIITGDELWFFFYYLCDSVLATSRDERPQRIKQKINRKTT
jgi:hypothetical protein